MNNGNLVVPRFDHQINLEYNTTPIALPIGTAWVRASIVWTQRTRELSDVGCLVQFLWTDALGRAPLPRNALPFPPRDSWAEDEEIPTSGHAVGSPPGVIPDVPGPFPYVVEQSPALDQVDVAKLPAGYDRVFLRYTLLGNRGNPVNAAVVFEALDSQEQPLEFL